MYSSRRSVIALCESLRRVGDQIHVSAPRSTRCPFRNAGRTDRHSTHYFFFILLRFHCIFQKCRHKQNAKRIPPFRTRTRAMEMLDADPSVGKFATSNQTFSPFSCRFFLLKSFNEMINFNKNYQVTNRRRSTRCSWRWQKKWRTLFGSTPWHMQRHFPIRPAATRTTNSFRIPYISKHPNLFTLNHSISFQEFFTWIKDQSIYYFPFLLRNNHRINAEMPPISTRSLFIFQINIWAESQIQLCLQIAHQLLQLFAFLLNYFDFLDLSFLGGGQQFLCFR